MTNASRFNKMLAVLKQTDESSNFRIVDNNSKNLSDFIDYRQNYDRNSHIKAEHEDLRIDSWNPREETE